MNNQSDKPIKELTEHDRPIQSLLYIKERDTLISVSCNAICIWNYKTFECINKIEDVCCNDINGLCQIDKDRVIVGEEKALTIINFDKCEIEHTIANNELDWIS